jgi:hypothetical protein
MLKLKSTDHQNELRINSETEFLASTDNVSNLHPMEWAIMQTVAYADVFDYPLTVDEVHYYLIGIATDFSSVTKMLQHSQTINRLLGQADGFVVLKGRECLIDLRQQRARHASLLWPKAMRYGDWIAKLPFVRMVAITGALSVNNVEPGHDIDYLIVTSPGRLWTCRAMIVLLVRLASQYGDTVCPNFILSENAFLQSDQSLYTAHEIVQMIPLHGIEIYKRFRQSNCWTEIFLPNAKTFRTKEIFQRNANADLRKPDQLKRLSETLLNARYFKKLEEWEMARKVRKFSAQQGYSQEASFAMDYCKGHFHNHAFNTINALSIRLEQLLESMG